MLSLVLLAAALQADVLRTIEGKDGAPWSKIEVLEDRRTKFAKEEYLDTTRHREYPMFGGGVVRAFESEKPAPNLSLLHFAGEPKEAKEAPPVLLLHGVGTDSTLSYHAKNIGGEEGLAPWLVQRGRRVFALTFAVPHGDNVAHAIHVAHAVKRVLEVTGAGRVDIIAHSMGGIAARAFIQSADPRIPPYQGQVRRLVLVAVPNAGLDLTFRHPVSYLWFGRYGFPSPWTRKEGKDVTKECITGGAFNGHLQMLADLRTMHPLSEREDHVHDTYVGNKFEGGVSPGLAAAEKQGGQFMKRLNGKGMPRGVEIFLVAGNDNVLRYYDKSGQVRTQIGEYDGPADGLVFVKSVFGLPKAVPVKDRLELHVPHFELVYADEVKQAVEGWLSAE